ncbi:hypothetical protein IEO21_05910 [Rhodonia placenta]|uniref:Uncharacterized protein n=1 Tax=Rhodonia placenta TaxID=104341 RepID=A0A8H7P111_9APHY|nr:hypothetical protein IEO21_05910 [Postia placenta]
MSVTYDVYAQQLFRLGQGYPLWEPEPKDGVEVEIGDVGYLHRGGFYRIFNALRDPQDPLNATLGTPPDFEKFSSGAMQPHRVENAIASGPVASKTLRKISVAGELSVHNIGATCKYECTDDQGALLVLETPAVREELHQIRRLKNYFSKNINDWHTFAAGEIGLEKKPEEILFVRGWVKTTRWAVAAFTNQAKSAKISFDGNFASPATASFALEASESIAPQHDRRSGPEDRLRGEGHHHAREPAWPADQCVFLHYLKLKKRFLLLKTIEAAAEPQDPSVSGDDDDTIEECVKIQDPVDEVLDYILRVGT